MTKPRNPYPRVVRRLFKRLLPSSLFYRYIGRHEKGSTTIWKAMMNQLPDHGCVLDIGAFHGEYAVLAKQLRPSLHVYAFEPNPRSLAVLKEKVGQLDIHIEQLALSDEIGEATFTLSSARSQLTNTAPVGDAVSVSTITLDAWAKREGVTPHLIKIDIEGGEAQALSAGQEVLEQYQPVILCEVLDNDTGQQLANVLPESYLFYHIDEDSQSINRSSTIGRRAWRHRNWLFVPTTKLGMVETIE